MSLVFAALVWWTPSFRDLNGSYPALLYAIWIVGYCFHQALFLVLASRIMPITC